jgi:hypothetical protein
MRAVVDSLRRWVQSNRFRGPDRRSQ